jgi:hypothetical protein
VSFSVTAIGVVAAARSFTSVVRGGHILSLDRIASNTRDMHRFLLRWADERTTLAVESPHWGPRKIDGGMTASVWPGGTTLYMLDGNTLRSQLRRLQLVTETVLRWVAAAEMVGCRILRPNRPEWRHRLIQMGRGLVAGDRFLARETAAKLSGRVVTDQWAAPTCLAFWQILEDERVAA